MIGKIKREFSVESHPYPDLVIYEVSLDDLEQLEKETLTVNEDFSFFLFSSAVFISFVNEVTEALKPHIHGRGRLLITALKKPYQGFLPKDAWD
jgi:hypothetical protein